MASKKRKFQGMSYLEVQRFNSKNRLELDKEEQKWLKSNGYKNVGWDNVIKFYEKIKDFLSKADWTLEELFLEADRIGNKYLSDREIEDFNEKLSREVSEISEEIDRYFPDTEIEIIDFSQKSFSLSRQGVNKKRKKAMGD